MDAKLGYAAAHWLNVAEKISLKPLDPRNHNASNRGVCQMGEPRGELRERFDAEQESIVIDRLHMIKPARCGPPKAKSQLPRRCRRERLRRSEPVGRKHPLMADPVRPSAVTQPVELVAAQQTVRHCRMRRSDCSGPRDQPSSPLGVPVR
jgi:hypothetical protein